MELTIKEIAAAIGGRIIHGRADGPVNGYSTDSRTIAPGELYFALRGPRFDGHDFVAAALHIGAGAVVSVPPVAPPAGRAVILVPDTLRALQTLARHMRRKLGMKVVGITGSNGKTTTKEMTAAILSSRMRVHKNAGNLNNQIGLPQSMLKLEPADEVSVLEMGASAIGEIRGLCEIALPDVGVITNIGQAHLQGFGGIDGVRAGKLELLDFVPVAVLNADDAFLIEGARSYKGRAIGFGIEAQNADVCARDIELKDTGASFTLITAGGSAAVRLGVTGRFNVLNALAAAGVGVAFGLSAAEIGRSLEGFQAVPMRFERSEYHGAVLLADVYNANPGSMREAITELARMRQRRAIAVLGDMLELGPDSDRIHAELGAWMQGAVDCLIAVGPGMAHAAAEFEAKGGRALRTSSAIEARALLSSELRPGDVVLVKGSRGMAMEGAIDAL